MTDDWRDVLKDANGVGRVLGRVGDKWSLLVIVLLQSSPRRFNDIKRSIDGISQQMLTRTLRGLERDGLVSRSIFPSSPPQVEYALTELGQSFCKPALALGKWACDHLGEIDEAQRRFDGVLGCHPDPGLDPGEGSAVLPGKADPSLRSG